MRNGAAQKGAMVRVMCGVQINHKKGGKDLMLGLNETKDQLAMSSSVWCTVTYIYIYIY